MNMIIGITGLARAGKDTAAEYLISKYGFKHLDFARDALFPEAEKRGVQKDKMSLSIFGDELRAESGRGVLAKIILEKIETGIDYVITGFRSPEEVDYIRNATDEDFHLIEIFAEKMERFSRRKEVDPLSMEEFFERDNRDIHNKGLGDVLKMADFKLDNNGALEDFHKSIEEMMKKID